ncbi:MAG: hypothetical protein Q8922_02540 [Bacteroidota bacterium]|nr:hypothetical protein [Bacteroidota bacterium]MDP4234756.1 hypothetical protein [Bacteroidota bacterium]MDP4242648.1 hypothetical protein [Bacteroidota bacterium]MDP4286790.1 hypothetical protein [Bacteroidota bacterium]
MNLSIFRAIIAIAAVFQLASCKSDSTSTGGSTQPAANGANGVVRQAIYVGNTLFVAGDFDSIGGVWIRGVGMWDGAKWANVGSPLPVFTRSSIDALTTDSTNLYVAGQFGSTIGSENLSMIARWDGSQWHHMDNSVFTFGGSNYPRALTFDDGILNAYNGVGTIEQYDGKVWTASTIYAVNPFLSMIASGGRLYAVMGYNETNPYLWVSDSHNWAKQGGAFGTSSPDGPGVQIVARGTDVFAAGDFGQIGSTVLSSYGIAHWNGSQWSSVGMLTGTVKATAIAMDQTGVVYVAQPGKLLKYDGTSWSQVATTAGGFGNQGLIHTIAISSGHIAIGGEFTSVNGATANYVAILQ